MNLRRGEKKRKERQEIVSRRAFPIHLPFPSKLNSSFPSASYLAA
jgi:hypothetical protein